MSRNQHESPARKSGANSDAIEWKDYPRIPPGEYRAYCKWGKQYRDPGFRRWDRKASPGDHGQKSAPGQATTPRTAPVSTRSPSGR